VEALFKLADNIRKLSIGELFVLTFSDQETENYVLFLNRELQLRMGILADGSLLPFYSEISQEHYGKPNKRWTLYDTGYFYKSFDLSGVSEDHFLIEADGVKPNRDWTKYRGGNVLGLTDENKELLVQEIQPLMVKILKEKILKL